MDLEDNSAKLHFIYFARSTLLQGWKTKWKWKILFLVFDRNKMFQHFFRVSVSVKFRGSDVFIIQRGAGSAHAVSRGSGHHLPGKRKSNLGWVMLSKAFEGCVNCQLGVDQRPNRPPTVNLKMPFWPKKQPADLFNYLYLDTFSWKYLKSICI